MKPILTTCGQSRERNCELIREAISKQEEQTVNTSRQAGLSIQKEKKATNQENFEAMENVKRQFLSSFQRELPVDSIVNELKIEWIK